MNWRDILNAFIFGIVVGAVVNAVWWITTGGDYPGTMTTIILSDAVVVFGSMFLRYRRQQDIRKLEELYRLRSYGE